MVSYLDKLTALGYIGFKEGNITFGNDKLLFYFLPHLVDEYLLGTKCWGLDWGALQFFVGRRAGYQFVKEHGAKLGEELSHVIDASQNVLESLGWGRYSTWRFDKEKMYLLINGSTSTVADEIKLKHGPQQIPADFLVSGLFAGAASYYTRKKIYSIEIECRANENIDTCQFVAAEPNKILKYVAMFFPKRLKYARRYMKCLQALEKRIDER